MQLPPAAVIATWPTPNYVDPVTRGNGVLVVNIICISIAFVITLLRLYTRIFITMTAGTDDILIVISLVFSIAMVVITSVATEQWAYNRHMWDVPIDWFPTVERLFLAFQIMFSWASTFTKISILWFCRRLLGVGKGLFTVWNWAFIGSMIFVTIDALLFTFITTFQCSPTKAFWEVDPQYPHSCLRDGDIVFAGSVINIFTDFLVTILPMPLIWSLNLPTRQRLAVISIFALGIVVNVAGSVRTVYAWKSQLTTYDQTWEGWPVLIAASVEINLGLICSSAPALRPLVATFLPGALPSKSMRASSSRQSRSNKLWSSASHSRASHMAINANPYQESHENDRCEIMRTVEMATWSETRSEHDDITVETESRAVSPNNAEVKEWPLVSTSVESSRSFRLSKYGNESPSDDLRDRQ
ncbi:hypothetical protein N7478_002883 [Penicillium angulare]|uniref:uncharacterized protein n=1 Tax=Penicillium angulare TaxID=116970 RepID=UPI0025400487|nr:uncharacterized protein N7478_002883 [Penicillium angulare]KAJ5287197.1 hypothetical protein N7478_002883 [Penicillium angulare]